MNYKISQYRYYGEAYNSDTNNDLRENTKDTNRESLVKGTLFQGKAIYKIGIQSFPGASFTLNNSEFSKVIVGATGIFELDLENSVPVVGLRIHAETIDIINNNDSKYIIIDLFYVDDNEGGVL